MRTFSVILAAALVLTCITTSAEANRRRQAPKVEPPPVLSVRLDSGLGLNACVDHDDFDCGRQGEDVGAYGRLGVTLRALHIVDFLGVGLTLDLGGYVPDAAPGEDTSSVTFHLAAMIRGFIPLPNKRIELTAGIGIGLAHWTRTSSSSIVDVTTTWTGMTIPMTTGAGYEVYPGLVVGGDITFQPRIAGDVCASVHSQFASTSGCGGAGDLPFNLQVGAYVAYSFPVSLDPAGGHD
ncbi:MAG: hypothetical protein QF464_10160 [Myxococcota bacterium]|jgi:hypothetical protein|nr:hypothetical protein [Myxococcota bacterium]